MEPPIMSLEDNYSAESLLCWELEDVLHSNGEHQRRGDFLAPQYELNSSWGGLDMAVLSTNQTQTNTCADLQEAIAQLIQREAFHRPHPDYMLKYETRAFDAESRRRALSWIFEVQAFYNFGPLTTALAASYFDRFLSLHNVQKWKGWMMQLLSVACISLAAKMEETEVPLLLDLQMRQVPPIFFFEPKTIKRMELLVLDTLEWRVSSVTPFSYIDYFMCKCDVAYDAHYSIVARIGELVLSAIQELIFLSYPPSSIALAATLCAIQEMTPQKVAKYKRILFSLLPRDLQDLSERCFDLMIDLFRTPSLGLRYEACGDSAPRSPIRVLDASFSYDSESTFKSVGSHPSIHISSPAPKKWKVHDFCSS